jgi:hypothetical protein
MCGVEEKPHIAMAIDLLPGVGSMPIRLTPKATSPSVLSHERALGLSHDAAGNAAHVPRRERHSGLPAGGALAGWPRVPEPTYEALYSVEWPHPNQEKAPYG